MTTTHYEYLTRSKLDLIKKLFEHNESVDKLLKEQKNQNETTDKESFGECSYGLMEKTTEQEILIKEMETSLSEIVKTTEILKITENTKSAGDMEIFGTFRETEEKTIADMDSSKDVLIPIPFIYVNVNENEASIYAENYRIIEYELLKEFMEKYADKIEILTKTGANDLVTELLERIFSIDAVSEPTNWNLLNVLRKMMKDCSEYFDFVQLNQKPITFDKISKYSVDKYHLLTKVEYVTYKNKLFYSQLKSKNEVIQVRKIMNDTDFNRILFKLDQLKRTLLFEKDRSYYDLNQITCLYLFHILLVVHSNPLKHHSMSTLFSHYFALLMDCIIRSRCTQSWLESITNDEIKHALLANNINLAYKECFFLPTAEQRFTAFVKNPAFSGKMDAINYDEYKKILSKSKKEIKEKFYYCLNEEFTYQVATSNAVSFLQNKMQKNEFNAKDSI